MKGTVVLLLPVLLGIAGALAEADAAIPIAALDRQTPVDFQREVLPFLRANCLSCHCQTTKKGGLNLETPELMLKGGENGPAVDPGKGAESLALQAAAHQDADLKMPPGDNKVKARDLTPPELALLKLWIDQGAMPSAKVESEIHWQPLPASDQAIFAVAITPDGQFAACARANRLVIYHLPTGRCVATDESQHDQINALAFSPDGTLLASGGYREVKLWRRPHEIQRLRIPDAGVKLAVSPDGRRLATGADDGVVKLWELPGGKATHSLMVAAAPVAALAFSPQSGQLACGTDKSLTIWDTASGQQLARTETPAAVTAVVWLPGEIASGGADGVIRLWSEALAPRKELAGHAGAVSALTAAGQQLLSGGADGSVRKWDLEKGQSILQVNHGGPVTSVAARPDGKRLASAGLNPPGKLWDETGKPLAELGGDLRTRRSAEERERRLQVAASELGFRKTTQGETEKKLHAAQDRVKKSTEAIPPKQQALEAKQKAVTEAAEAKKAADQALGAAEGESKKATEALASAEKGVLEAKAAAEAIKIATPPDPAATEKAAADMAARSQEVEKAKAEVARREADRKQAADKVEPTTKKLAEATKEATAAETARMVAENELTLAKAEEQKMTELLGSNKVAAEGAEIARKNAEEEFQAARKADAEAGKPLRAVAFAPDGGILATAGDDQAVHTWSSENGAPCEVLDAPSAAVTGLGFTPGGELISTTADGAAVLRDGNPAWSPSGALGSSSRPAPFADRIGALAFSHNGEWLATGGGEPSRGGEIKLWKAATGELVRDLPNIHSDAVFGLAFSPDDKLLVSGSADKMARVINPLTGVVLRTLEGHAHHVLGVAWSMDGRTLATAGADNLVKIWDFPSGERRKNVEGYDKEVTAIRFIGATDELVTSSGDNRVRLVSAEGKEIRSFPAVADFMQSIAVTADGKMVIAGGEDSVLRVWNVADGKAVATFPPGETRK